MLDWRAGGHLGVCHLRLQYWRCRSGGHQCRAGPAAASGSAAPEQPADHQPRSNHRSPAQGFFDPAVLDHPRRAHPSRGRRQLRRRTRALQSRTAAGHASRHRRAAGRQTGGVGAARGRRHLAGRAGLLGDDAAVALDALPACAGRRRRLALFDPGGCATDRAVHGRGGRADLHPRLGLPRRVSAERADRAAGGAAARSRPRHFCSWSARRHCSTWRSCSPCSTWSLSVGPTACSIASA